MINTREYNEKRFSIYESEEKTALGLMNELGQACNEVLDRTDIVEKENKKKVSYEELHNNYQLTTDGTTANFNGSWQGLDKPTLTQEGTAAQVEKNMADIIVLNKLNKNKMDKDTTNISVSQINKNLGKLDQSYMTDEFLQQIAGETPISSTVANKSITNDKLSENVLHNFLHDVNT